MYRFGTRLFRLSSRFSSSMSFPEMPRSSAYVVRCSGLPWKSTKQDVLSFLGSAGLDAKEVNLLLRSDGEASGDAFVSFGTKNSYDEALSKHGQYIGKRWIEMLPSKQEEMEYFTRMYSEYEQQKSWERDFVVRLRGLPYQAKESDVAEFFQGLEIAEGGIRVVLMQTVRNRRRCNGTAYVQFADMDSALGALERNNREIRGRYIQVSKSSFYDMVVTTTLPRRF